MCRALNFIHCLKDPIIHRDIEPSNILIGKYANVKICDLGSCKCKQMDNRLLTTQHSVQKKKFVKGTIVYLPPEILLRKEEVTEKVYVWAAALTIIELYSYEESYVIGK